MAIIESSFLYLCSAFGFRTSTDVWDEKGTPFKSGAVPATVSSSGNTGMCILKNHCPSAKGWEGSTRASQETCQV